MGEKLGQHFLINTDAIQRISEGVDIKKGETIIEIGPGAGALTKPLAQICKKVGAKLICIEKDPELAHALTLHVQSGELERAEIITGDALHELPRLAQQQAAYKLVGNIPYYITGHLLRIIGELKHKPVRIVLMIQKEVAERVSAKPGEMNLLAAATQIWATVQLLFTLPPSDFDPPPQVHSAVVTLTPKDTPVSPEEATHYYESLHVMFKQPRKMLINNLSEKISREEATALIKELNLSEKSRPQDLTVQQIVTLSSLL